jgi:hypothetical protein
MEKLFVPYELSVKLKEKGFDEKCFGYYYNETRLSYPQDRERDYFGITLFTNNFLKTHETPSFRLVAAPLYTQAFKWFRDNHNLNGEVYQVLLSHNDEYREQKKNESEYTFRINVNGIPEFDINNIYPSYEEAELFCMKELITNLK